jgi:DNA-binding CsgD family transcriptional regulator
MVRRRLRWQEGHRRRVRCPAEAAARLLVERWTDREIGQILNIGTRTFAFHVANILNKLDVDNRCGRAAAVRLGLV